MNLAWLWGWVMVLVFLGLPMTFINRASGISVSPLWLDPAWWATDLPGQLARLHILMAVWIWIQVRSPRLDGRRQQGAGLLGLIAAGLLLALLSRGLLATVGVSPLDGWQLIRIHP